jgi:hypothetical protein
MISAERDPYLSSVDQVLFPLGFKRLKKDFEWTRSVDLVDTLWIHLNFGLAVINPSFGVRYTDLDKALPPEAGGRFGTMQMLSSLSAKSYSSPETSPLQIANDILEIALPHLQKLRDRCWVVDRLQSESPNEWPLTGASFRMRLLPLLLATSGRISDGLDWLNRFEIIALEKDQLIPSYNVFAGYFRKKYEV